jgi:hypothetical protein
VIFEKHPVPPHSSSSSSIAPSHRPSHHRTIAPPIVTTNHIMGRSKRSKDSNGIMAMKIEKELSEIMADTTRT